MGAMIGLLEASRAMIGPEYQKATASLMLDAYILPTDIDERGLVGGARRRVDRSSQRMQSAGAGLPVRLAEAVLRDVAHQEEVPAKNAKLVAHELSRNAPTPSCEPNTR